MPTTRQQRQKESSALLSGLVEAKRIQNPRPVRSSTASKLSTRKERNKNKDPSLAHTPRTTALLEFGTSNFPETSGQARFERIVWEPRKVPITDPSQLPEGWSADEPDLSPDDIEAQIERAKERISVGIMPQLFESRLRTFSRTKQQQMDMIRSEPQGLTWEVVQRLSCLKHLEKNLVKEDNDDNLSNVEAIINAYRSKSLSWHGDAVSYWSNGRLIAGPKKLDSQELYALSARYGPKGFWVEGIDGFSPGPLYLFLSLNSRHPSFALHTINILVRNPTTQETSTMATTMTLDFLEDSGSSTMRIFSDDKRDLETLSNAHLPILGQAIKQTAMGQIQVQNVMLQVNISHNGRLLLPYWVDVVASVTPRNHASEDRLSGLWIQHLLYVLSMPDNTRRKHIGTDIGEILTNVPAPDYKNAVPPPFY